mmetsp:Transcript_29570/g.75293  ORF Transcript_29570/g.75293 Transcript_29570/m.75293 type:complete len:286 (-) Transcript_29570:481-1338(-)
MCVTWSPTLNLEARGVSTSISDSELLLAFSRRRRLLWPRPLNSVFVRAALRLLRISEGILTSSSTPVLLRRSPPERFCVGIEEVLITSMQLLLMELMDRSRSSTNCCLRAMADTKLFWAVTAASADLQQEVPKKRVGLTLKEPSPITKSSFVISPPLHSNSPFGMRLRTATFASLWATSSLRFDRARRWSHSSKRAFTNRSSSSVNFSLLRVSCLLAGDPLFTVNILFINWPWYIAGRRGNFSFLVKPSSSNAARVMLSVSSGMDSCATTEKSNSQACVSDFSPQ